MNKITSKTIQVALPGYSVIYTLISCSVTGKSIQFRMNIAGCLDELLTSPGNFWLMRRDDCLDCFNTLEAARVAWDNF